MHHHILYYKTKFCFSAEHNKLLYCFCNWSVLRFLFFIFFFIFLNGGMILVGQRGTLAAAELIYILLSVIIDLVKLVRRAVYTRERFSFSTFISSLLPSRTEENMIPRDKRRSGKNHRMRTVSMHIVLVLEMQNSRTFVFSYLPKTFSIHFSLILKFGEFWYFWLRSHRDTSDHESLPFYTII